MTVLRLQAYSSRFIRLAIIETTHHAHSLSCIKNESDFRKVFEKMEMLFSISCLHVDKKKINERIQLGGKWKCQTGRLSAGGIRTLMHCLISGLFLLEAGRTRWNRFVLRWYLPSSLSCCRSFWSPVGTWSGYNHFILICLGPSVDHIYLQLQDLGQSSDFVTFPFLFSEWRWQNTWHKGHFLLHVTPPRFE